MSRISLISSSKLHRYVSLMLENSIYKYIIIRCFRRSQWNSCLILTPKYITSQNRQAPFHFGTHFPPSAIMKHSMVTKLNMLPLSQACKVTQKSVTTSFFLEILSKFYEQLSYRKLPNSCFHWFSTGCLTWNFNFVFM